MSFRLFIYYCAMCGGFGALVGWGLGTLLDNEQRQTTLRDGLLGLWLGLAVACGLGLLDALWNLSLTQFLTIFGRVLTAVLVGCLGGLFGGIVGSMLFQAAKGNLIAGSIFFVFGWTLTGLLIGASLGVFDVTAAALRNQDTRNALKKVRNGLIGGGVGGILGGILSLLIGMGWVSVFAKPKEILWAPTGWGFVALGACIGLFIAVAQVVLTEAWLKVEAGFRKGREMLLSKPEVTIGRAESCDIGLFGDNQIERLHAKIQQRGNDYILTDNGTPSGTYVNDQRLNGPRALRSGDVIRLGRCLLRFGERQKK